MERHDIRPRFVRFLGESGVAGMAIRACTALDPECTQPLATATTDADGYANVSVPRGFGGFLDLAPPASFSSMVPSLTYQFPPPDKDEPLDKQTSNALAAHLTSVGELNFLLGQVGSAVDPALGHLLGIVLDCQGNPVPGVTIRASIKDKKTLGYYTDATGLPSVSLSATSQRGEAGFVNMPTGQVTVETTVNGLQKKGGQYTVLVKAGHITYLPMSPSP